MDANLIKENPSKFRIFVEPDDDLFVIFSVAISNVRKGEILGIIFNSLALEICQKEIMFLTRLQSLAKQFGFIRVSFPYSETRTWTFEYRGEDLPGDVSLGFSFKHINTVRKLFQSVFGEEMSFNFWRWKYENKWSIYSPILLKNNQAVAHYGFIPRKLCFLGGTYTGLQACDDNG